MNATTQPYDNKRIFWDVDHTSLDFEKKASFIIERVFERGDVQDIRNCRRYYGDEKIAEVLLNAKWLMPETISLAAALFDNNPQDYKCYQLQQSNPTPFQY